MIVRPIFECKEYPEWKLYPREGQLSVQRCPMVGESVSLAHSKDYKVIEVQTDLYQDDIWLCFEPLPAEEFIFIYWDQHNMETNTNHRWVFEPGTDKKGKEDFFRALAAYDKQVDEDLAD